VALIVMVIAEMVASSDGIGYFILAAQRGFQNKQMYAGVVSLAIVGYGLNRIFVVIENRVLAWHHGQMQRQKS
jgi:ABC-type nitrate/sulfonate/bicarbonate transport system permease component